MSMMQPSCSVSNSVVTCADERGATAVEYALLAALIAAVIASIAGTFGQEVLDLFTTIEGKF